MLMNSDIVMSSVYGAIYGAILGLILAPLYSWALRQRESLRMLVTLFVAFLGPAFILVSKKTGEILMISENDDLSGYFFAFVSIAVFIIYGKFLNIFGRKPRRD